MIKFFRRIRKRLLNENRISSYLLYAIGEIFLVIIGILIALAINQKQTDRDNDELRDLYLIQLSDEADHNIEELLEYRDSATRRLDQLDTLYQILIDKDHDNPKLLLKSRYLYGRTTFKPLMTTYENLKFSGDLKLFDDLELRNSISESYNTFNHIQVNEKIDLEVIDVYYQDYYMSNAKLTDLDASKDNFGKDDYFENTVVVRRVTLRQVKDAYEYSIEALKELKTTFSDLRESR